MAINAKLLALSELALIRYRTQQYNSSGLTISDWQSITQTLLDYIEANREHVEELEEAVNRRTDHVNSLVDQQIRLNATIATQRMELTVAVDAVHELAEVFPEIGYIRPKPIPAPFSKYDTPNAWAVLYAAKDGR